MWLNKIKWHNICKIENVCSKRFERFESFSTIFLNEWQLEIQASKEAKYYFLQELIIDFLRKNNYLFRWKK